MDKNESHVDNVRYSREGHSFHDTWTARKCLQLLIPRDGLVGIAVEGLSPIDNVQAFSGTIEIADLTLYYGEDADFSNAEKVEILQFKYSTTEADKPLRCSGAKETLKKFAESFRQNCTTYGKTVTLEKLSFEFVTNKPIFGNFRNAIVGIAKGEQLRGEAREQAKQFEKATGLEGSSLRDFAARFEVRGTEGTVKNIHSDVRNTLIDWSGTADAIAYARLGEIKELVRRKASPDFQNNNVIRQVDLLAVLGLSATTDLCPCESRFPDIGTIVEREQLLSVAQRVRELDEPLILHAEGGVGKTVFLRSLAALISLEHEVVLFDCFAGGAYRTPDDGRHRPDRGLVHIANDLACRGLCDPILPGYHIGSQNLVATFRKRLEQCIRTTRKVFADRWLVLIIDAIDNAQLAAERDSTKAFPMLLLESLSQNPIPGVVVIASGRTHRINEFMSEILCHEVNLNPFTLEETTRFLKDRLSSLRSTEFDVAQARSGGNARVLDYLVTSGNRSFDESQIANQIELDDLLTTRVQSVFKEALTRGYTKKEINTFLAGLSVLPPPVPLEEYAGAHGIETGAVESFVADLAPLLEQTPQGLIFRDEPTETFIREKYGGIDIALKRVSRNLFARQEESLYAAQALPGLLLKLGELKKLVRLALDTRLPSSSTSKIGQRKIRHARLIAAIQIAAQGGDHDSLVRLLVELSAIESSDQRGTNYIVEHPDLVANLHDPDAMRRIQTTRTNWPGSRHTRLLVMYVLLGDMTEASRCFIEAEKWIRQHEEITDEDEYDRSEPESIDMAAIPFYLFASGDSCAAIRFLEDIRGREKSVVISRFYGLVCQFNGSNSGVRHLLRKFLACLTDEMELIDGALVYVPLKKLEQRDLLEKLSKANKKKRRNARIGSRGTVRYSSHSRATILALSMGMLTEARSISHGKANPSPSIWSVVSSPSLEYEPHLIRLALHAAVSGLEVSAQDMLPYELEPLGKGLRRGLTEEEQKIKLQRKLQLQLSKEIDLAEKQRSFSTSLARDAERYIEQYFVPLLTLARALSGCFAAPQNSADAPFRKLVELWESKFKSRNRLFYGESHERYFRHLGTNILAYALELRRDLRATSVRHFLTRLHRQEYVPDWLLIRVISIAALKPSFENIVGEQTSKAVELINLEDDVSTRADLFADLAMALLPMIPVDAKTLFRKGIDDLDAIGSGDFEFVREILEFAASLEGAEISEQGFHTLTNLCELNLSDDLGKFCWGLFGKAMSKTSGLKGLVKLARWHDRENVDLAYTLQPYLTAVVADGKITPEDAVSLNRLSLPVQSWDAKSASFVTSIREKRPKGAGTLIEELARQNEHNNRYLVSDSAIWALRDYALDDLGKRHPIYRSIARDYREVKNSLRRSQFDLDSSRSDRLRKNSVSDADEKKFIQIRKLASKTDPLDADSMQNAISRLANLRFFGRAELEFFERLRSKVRANKRTEYLGLVSNLVDLDLYGKLNELKKCKKLWDRSSISLRAVLQSISSSLLDLHHDEIVDSSEMCRVFLGEISELTGETLPTLATDLLKTIQVSNLVVPASVWLCLATFVCEKAGEGIGQKALEALLQGEAGKLASEVTDGPLQGDSYPAHDPDAIAAGLLWQSLGSPRARERWYAAHSVRCFASFGRWRVIDALVERIEMKNSISFSAKELDFYYLHARLWLLISLARLALDYPSEIACYRSVLTKIALTESPSHLIFRHFAAQAVLTCERKKALQLANPERARFQMVNESELPERQPEEQCSNNSAEVNQSAPIHTANEFSFDYDFEKYGIQSLASVFAQPFNSVKNKIALEIKKLDPKVKAMYENDGRDTPLHRGVALNSEYELYGQYLAWHGFHIAASQLLGSFPVTKSPQIWEDSWTDWLEGKFLTRGDGLWLADGMDRIPPSTKVDVLERDSKNQNEQVITGNREKILNLVGIRVGEVGRELVVYGDWKSSDDVTIYVSSALVNERKGRKLARDLLGKNDPFSVWLPTLDYDSQNPKHVSRGFEDYKPWIVSPSREAAILEKHDPLSVISVEIRPRFSPDIVDRFNLRQGDRFQSSWLAARSRIVAKAEAWGRKRNVGQAGQSNARLICKRGFIKKVLEWKRANLILVIELNRFQKDHAAGGGTYSSTFAVVRLRKDLKVEYIPGPVNRSQRSDF